MPTIKKKKLTLNTKTNSIPAKLFPFYLHSFLCFDTFSYTSVIFDVNKIRWERNHLLPIVFLEIHSRTKMSCTSQAFEKNSFRTERIKQKKKAKRKVFWLWNKNRGRLTSQFINKHSHYILIFTFYRKRRNLWL